LAGNNFVLFHAIISLFCSRFWFWKQKFAYVSAIEKLGRVDFGHVDLGTLQSGLLIWISFSFLVLLEGING
jgi:hypothetical protein